MGRRRESVLKVGIKDCDVQTFRAGGPGGQNQNKRDTAVRIIHRPSGAVGESREERSQLANKRLAFRRMGESAQFRLWAEMVVRGVEKQVDDAMKEENLVIEYGF
jgi:protein subunit release factor B